MLFLSDNQNRNHSLQRGLPVNRPISFVAAAQSRRIPKLLIATTDLAIGQKSTSISNADILSFNNSVRHHRLHEKTYMKTSYNITQPIQYTPFDGYINRSKWATSALPFKSLQSEPFQLFEQSETKLYSFQICGYRYVPKDLDHITCKPFTFLSVLAFNSQVWVRPERPRPFANCPLSGEGTYSKFTDMGTSLKTSTTSLANYSLSQNEFKRLLVYWANAPQRSAVWLLTY